jgi:hypothetical protein
VTGARRLEVDLDKRVWVEWKPMPRLLDGINDSPRKELAAYQFQELFLDPGDYVVPTSAPCCLETAYFHADAERVLEGSHGAQCALAR